MKVTFYIGSLYGGGAERVTCCLANYFADKDYDVDILTMAESKESYELDRKVSNTILLKNSDRKNKARDFFHRWRGLVKYLRESDTDVFVVMLPVTTIMLLLLKDLTTKPIIAAERADPSSYSFIKQKLLRLLASRADKYVFQTDEIRKWYGDHVKDEKSIVIPNAINPAFMRPMFEGVRDKSIVGIGRLTEQKNFSMLVKAFSEVHKFFPEYQLIIYGDGLLRDRLKQEVKELQIDNYVSLPGNVKDIISKLERTSIFVLSSKFEGMPNALIEAMALGIPCISTDCSGGGARFLIDDRVNGLLIPSGDKDALINAILELLSSQDLMNNLGRKARELSKKLAPQEIYKQWEKCIVDVGQGEKL